MARRSWFLTVLVFLSAAASAQNLEMGPRYDAMDALALRVRTTFADASARSVRESDGKIRTELRDSLGVETLLRLEIAGGQVRVTGMDGGTKAVARKLAVKPTMDWANALAYSLWRDRETLKNRPVRERTALRWKDGYLRAGRGSDDAQQNAFNAEIRSVTTYFDEFVAYTVMRPAPVKGFAPEFAGVLRRASTQELVGSIAWYADEQRLTWDVTGGGPGEATPATMGKAWPFRPNAAWANVQLRSFAQSYADVAERHEREGRLGGVEAHNSPGCDGLHWLDNSNLRPCCDQHDWCYEARTPNCTYHSWWWWRGNWSCVACNIKVILCFGIHIYNVDPFRPPPNPGSGGSGWLPDEFVCVDMLPGYCPASCAWCEYYY